MTRSALRPLVLLVLGLVLGLVLAAPAGGAPASPGVQAEADAIAAWMTDALNVEIEPRPVYVEPRFEDDRSGEYDARTGSIGLTQEAADSLVAEWTTHTYRGRLVAQGAVVVIHEHLHDVSRAACWPEEGIVHALTADLVPAYTWKRYRVRALAPTAGGYLKEVAAVRAASRFGSGSRSWRDRAARLWRRAVWQADCAGRAAMLAHAERARDAAAGVGA